LENVGAIHFPPGGEKMAVHHGRKISKAARTLAKKTSTKKQKTEAAKYMNKHKEQYH
jgi:hypothetical protein